MERTNFNIVEYTTPSNNPRNHKLDTKNSNTIKIITDLSLYQKHEVSVRFISMNMDRLHTIIANSDNIEICITPENIKIVSLIVKDLDIQKYSINENIESIDFKTIYRDSVNYFLVERF